MNEFIVWYDSDIHGRFSQEFTLDELCAGSHLEKLKKIENEEIRIYQIKNAIGIKDIDGKKIYADCSIVEFEHKYNSRKKSVDGWLTFQSFPKEQSELLQGYFVWNSDELRYEINILNHVFFICLDFVSTMKNFTIIDTIQENKLGLIK